MGRRTQVALAAAGALALIVGVLAYVIETDEEAIERITEDCRSAFLAGDADRIITHLLPDATGQGRIGNGSLAEIVRRAVAGYSKDVRSIEFTKHEIRVDGDEARSQWLAWVKLRRSAQQHGVGVFRIQAAIEYRRSAEGWRIRRFESGAP